EGAFLSVEPQVGLALVLVGAVAGVAVVGQDRPDVAIELHDLRERGLRRCPAPSRYQRDQADAHPAQPVAMFHVCLPELSCKRADHSGAWVGPFSGQAISLNYWRNSAGTRPCSSSRSRTSPSSARPWLDLAAETATLAVSGEQGVSAL